MKKQRVVITGGSGLLAVNWACAVRDTWDVVLGTHQRSVRLAGATSESIDLDRPDVLLDKMTRLMPDLVVHTAALTNVDLCEDDRDAAYHNNAVIARNVAETTAKKKIPLVHISTDHLFSGQRSFYLERDLPEPLNEYGRTKALAESWVQAAHPAALIVRTNFFCWGHRRRQSFTDWLIDSMRRAQQITLFDDVFFTPILADALTHAVHDLVDQRASGIIHLVGHERISKYDFGILLARRFDLPVDSIMRGRLADANMKAARPRDMSLDSGRARQILNRSLGTVGEYFDELLRQEHAGRHAELLDAVA